jgi:hypothetical protein
MKHYECNKAFDRIIEASAFEPEDQLLFLVPDVHNKHDENAVMLHDGVRKLGHVAAREAYEIRKYLEKEAVEQSQDQVIVVSIRPINDPGAFKWSTSVNVTGIGIVYERIARKYAQAVNR